MHIERLMLAVAVAAAFSVGASSVSRAQTTSTGTTTTATGSTSTSGSATSTSSTSSTGSTTAVTPGTTSGTASGTATSGSTTTAGTTSTTSSTPTPNASGSETQYLRHVPTRFVTLAGSSSNLQSLVHGLRTGSSVTLTSVQGSGSTATTQSVTFTPPTKPMGYGNITHALTLASRELAAAGIKNPTPQQLQTALMGGTITTAQGSVTMPGVLQLRSQGMGWGQIAHTIGVRPGERASGHEIGEQSGHGITTASGAKTGSTATNRTNQEASEHSVKAHRGIVTASGAGASTVPANTRAGTGIVTASGASTTGGIVSAAGSGNATTRGHEGKH